MARKAKPLSELSPAYRRRIERGLTEGKSRQEARGKGAGESPHRVIRKPPGRFTPVQYQVGTLPSSAKSYRGGQGANAADLKEALSHINTKFVRLAIYGIVEDDAVYGVNSAAGTGDFQWKSVLISKRQLMALTEPSKIRGNSSAEIASFATGYDWHTVTAFSVADSKVGNGK